MQSVVTSQIGSLLQTSTGLGLSATQRMQRNRHSIEAVIRPTGRLKERIRWRVAKPVHAVPEPAGEPHVAANGFPTVAVATAPRHPEASLAGTFPSTPSPR